MVIFTVVRRLSKLASADLISRLIDPGFDPDGLPDGDDYKDTRWYPALLRLITRVRDEAKAGNTALTPDELDEQLAEFKQQVD